MKTMTCMELGGACDKEFHAETFDEMAQQSKEHGMEINQQQDPDHLAAMKEMGKLMQDPDAMREWMASKRKAFDELPEN